MLMFFLPVILTCRFPLILILPIQRQERGSQKQFANRKLRYGWGSDLRETRALLGLEPGFLTPRLGLCLSGPEQAQEALKGATWWAGRPVAPESGGHHPALPCPQFLTPTKGQGGRDFMAEGIYGRDNSLFSELRWPEPPREQFYTHPCNPQMGFPAGALGPTPGPEPEMAPFPICAGALWGQSAPVNPP